ncbi:MAG: DUF2059 domain-containing protein [Alphaproteobacteria bacterium]|nr:DUF2059 domain-containing protein [Alphaproteobacteria bacterium]
MTRLRAAALGIVLGLAGLAGAARAEPDEARLVAAKELVAAAGMTDQFDLIIAAMLDQLMPLFTQANPGAESRVQTIVKEELTKAFLGNKQAFIDDMTQVFAESYTLETLQATLAFYRSPAGLEFVSKQPELTQKSLAIGQKFGLAAASDAIQALAARLKEEGLNTPTSL